jgi:hypothetical protein
MRWLFLIPWVLFLLGLLPLGLQEPVGDLGQGSGLLLAAFLLSGVASLYSRFPVAFSVQTALVLGLGLLAFQLALESALRLTGLTPPPYAYLGGVLGALALGLGFFLGTGREAPLLPPLSRVGTREDLLRMAGALEGLALRRPLVLVYLGTSASPEAILRELRRGDLAWVYTDAGCRKPGPTLAQRLLQGPTLRLKEVGHGEGQGDQPGVAGGPGDLRGAGRRIGL